jgi:hypothetical protein
MRNGIGALLALLLGEVVFWIPYLFLFRWKAIMPHWEAAIDLAGPAVLAAAYSTMLLSRGRFKAGPSLAICSLIGVWVLAPWFMTLAARLQSNAALTTTYLEEWPVLLEMSICPLLTLYFGIMQGSIGGLLAATFLMLIAHGTLERGRWIIPPQVRMWLKRSS